MLELLVKEKSIIFSDTVVMFSGTEVLTAISTLHNRGFEDMKELQFLGGIK